MESIGYTYNDIVPKLLDLIIVVRDEPYPTPVVVNVQGTHVSIAKSNGRVLADVTYRGKTRSLRETRSSTSGYQLARRTYWLVQAMIANWHMKARLPE